MRKQKIDLNFLWLMAIWVLLALFGLEKCWAKEARTLRLNDRQVAKIFISPGQSTILSFSMKPTKVILGNRGVFALEYVENDLAIASLTTIAHSNLFVYLPSGRFAFELLTTQSAGDGIVIVKETYDKQIKVKSK